MKTLQILSNKFLCFYSEFDTNLTSPNEKTPFLFVAKNLSEAKSLANKLLSKHFDVVEYEVHPLSNFLEKGETEDDLDFKFEHWN